MLDLDIVFESRRDLELVEIRICELSIISRESVQSERDIRAMEDATAIRYWCHLCSRSVNPVIEGEIIKCNFCQSGFVEEMEDNAPDSDHRGAADSLWAMMNDHGDDQNNDGEIDLDRQFQEIMRRRRGHSAAILDLLQGIRAGLSVQSESNKLDTFVSIYSQAVLVDDIEEEISKIGGPRD